MSVNDHSQQARVVNISFTGSLFSFPNCTINNLHEGRDSHTVKRRRIEPEITPLSVPIPANRLGRVKYQIIHPVNGAKYVADEPLELPDDLWQKYDQERLAVLDLYGRRPRADAARRQRMLELGRVWLKYYTILQAMKRS